MGIKYNYLIDECENLNPYNGHGWCIMDLSKERKTRRRENLKCLAMALGGIIFATALIGSTLYAGYKLDKITQKIERAQPSNSPTLENKFNQ